MNQIQKVAKNLLIHFRKTEGLKVYTPIPSIYNLHSLKYIFKLDYLVSCNDGLQFQSYSVFTSNAFR